MSTLDPGSLLLSDLNPSKKRVSVCVRVSRMWDFIRDGRLAHVDLVLIDEKGNKMHVEIASGHAEQFKKVLKEGDVYILWEFFVQSSKNMFRPVEGRFMIRTTPWTKIQPKDNVPMDFPRYAYSLTAFPLLPRLVGKRDAFIDAMGILVAISVVLHVRLPGQSSESLKRTLQLIDIDGMSIDAALWGRHATSFDADSLYQTAQSKPIIVLFAGTLIKNYLGRDTISCGDAGKFYINPEIPEASKYLERMGKQLPSVQWIEPQDDRYKRPFEHCEPEKVTVSTLLESDPNEFLGKNMICTVTIIRLQPSDWWFLACNGCHKTAYASGDEFTCSDERCSCVAAGPRYRVRAIVSDDTGEIEFVFFDAVAEMMIGKRASTLTRTATRRPGVVPAEISALVSQRYTLNVSINERGLQYGELSFQANNVCAIHTNAKPQEFSVLASGSASKFRLSAVPVPVLQVAATAEASFITDTDGDGTLSPPPFDTPTKTPAVSTSDVATPPALPPSPEKQNDSTEPTSSTDPLLKRSLKRSVAQVTKPDAKKKLFK